MNNDNPRGSRAQSPDLDWSQVRETVLMLELAAGQVEAAMRESGSSVEVLTTAFTQLAGTLGQVSAAAAVLPSEGSAGAARHDIEAGMAQVSEKVHQAVVAFQFYDKLAQRLSHVCHSLADLSNLVSDKGRLYNPEEWVELQQRIRGKYTMAEEVAMFEAVVHGTPVQEALERFMAEREQATAGGDIELF
ncbi:MAG: hypothetical protein JNM82_10865 [Rhodocyclaceae bacterium]|nr:hypothetical protein [Rhodocyclaceae bacterium]